MSMPEHQASCADPIERGLMSVETARERLLAAVQPLETVERLALRAALGRVLAEPVVSTLDVPAHTNSAMDGYALRGADLPVEGTADLTVIGDAFAGHPFTGRVSAGECVRIMTGAPLPDGADTVVMQERVQREGDRLTVGSGHRAGENVRLAGEDVAAGDAVLAPGRRLTPSDLGVIASLGIAEVAVVRRPRVAFFSTGDELRGVGSPLAPGEIYDSNRYTLQGMLARLGVEALDLGVVPDDPDRLREALLAAAASADAIVTSGGVSVGEADYVKAMLDELGEAGFWKIAMKPGRPLTFGRIGQALFFGLPGNPVSVMATFYQFVQPALTRLAGGEARLPLTVPAVTAGRLRKRPGRTEFQRGVLTRGEDGSLSVVSTGAQGSGVLSSMSRANCFIVLPAESGSVEPGQTVLVQPFDAFV